MIVRVLLAVLLAAALVTAAMPAIEDARSGVAASTADRETQRVAEAVDRLPRRSDPVPRDVPGARRVLDVDPGPRGTIRIGAAPGVSGLDADGDVVSFEAGGTRDRSPVAPPVRVVGQNGTLLRDGRPLVVRDRLHVVLRYELVDGRPVVTVARLYPG
ncbi:MAG: hypothetical protein ABEJ59_02055 [Halanaeroarchaeum sp.]